MFLRTLITGIVIIQVFNTCHADNSDESQLVAILPVPKNVKLESERLCFSGTIYFYSANKELDTLYSVLKEDLMVVGDINLTKTTDHDAPGILIGIDSSLKGEEYQVKIDNQIIITGGTYNAVAMGTATIMQMLQLDEKNCCWQKGTIRDYPDLHFRGLLIDVARRKHDLANLKNIVRLCRWYKINYLQLHLTDHESFTFPSEIYPQLVTDESHFTESELSDLVNYAHIRGVEIIPELEAPGHAAQMIEKMPKVFGFTDKALNKGTLNMARDTVYSALDTLIGEVARIFKYSEYIHIGGDETDFSDMENNVEVADYLQKRGVSTMEELYWQFINRMSGFVKKRGRKTMVWEGFSKKGNNVVDKDILVMAWETKYQLPQDLLDGGYKILNVSWKPLYVANEKKWSPRDIYNWSILDWKNWVPEMPSFTPIKISANPNILGGFMASWLQPQYTEMTSLRTRVPAMVDRVWNLKKKVTDSIFLTLLRQTDTLLSPFLSPVKLTAKGLTYPGLKDGQYDEQTWFTDTATISLRAFPDYVIHYSLDGSPVDANSAIYDSPLNLLGSHELRYRAYNKDKPVGPEQLEYYELHPLLVNMDGNFSIPPDQLWETTRAWIIGFRDSVNITFAAKRKGIIRYMLGDKELTGRSPIYTQPFSVKDTVEVKAGLFGYEGLIGKPWIQQFRKE